MTINASRSAFQLTGADIRFRLHPLVMLGACWEQTSQHRSGPRGASGFVVASNRDSRLARKALYREYACEEVCPMARMTNHVPTARRIQPPHRFISVDYDPEDGMPPPPVSCSIDEVFEESVS